ncbi:hypothetical protein C8E03_108196 [Lachnotalea glycerini]|uniref:Phage tail protein n=1 Tax=Lachnotalea glycerini TaxID=1763509 RepID=A0A318EPP7_9FIRM|nr:hypothetical protein [Lachnotalea glycerini]OYP01993.1 hypothetical protein CG709_10710 [Lachnotalea glycerini]PXV88469.1 hypothetical protein C8E03_108196 [Lachnotalea glycerini]
MAFITINGKQFPAPARFPKLVISTLVDAGRNANGVVVGQKIGRDQNKVDSLTWPVLDATTWASMLQEFSGFFVIATIWDMAANDWVTIKMYPGDRTADVLEIDDSGRPVKYKDCAVNIIDCGL